MNQIYVKARAKVNLTLNILNKRSDGYHKLNSVFQIINFYDEIWIKKNDNNVFKLFTNIDDKVKNEDNIVFKAYKFLKDKYPQISGINVKVKKNIPMEAGLGGGSADCANFMKALNKLFDLGIDNKQMILYASKLGADVAPCLYRKATYAEGIGEQITEISTKFKYYFVIVKPKISCNTRELFDKLDEYRNIKKDTSENNNYDNNSNLKNSNVILGLENNDLNLIADNLFNDFENIVDDEIIKIKSILLSKGAKASLMTGSGSAVYGIFEDKIKAKNAYENLKRQYEVHICTSFNV